MSNESIEKIPTGSMALEYALHLADTLWPSNENSDLPKIISAFDNYTSHVETNYPDADVHLKRVEDVLCDIITYEYPPQTTWFPNRFTKEYLHKLSHAKGGGDIPSGLRKLYAERWKEYKEKKKHTNSLVFLFSSILPP